MDMTGNVLDHARSKMNERFANKVNELQIYENLLHETFGSLSFLLITQCKDNNRLCIDLLKFLKKLSVQSNINTFYKN